LIERFFAYSLSPFRLAVAKTTVKTSISLSKSI
jgi:hypothetical protein